VSSNMPPGTLRRSIERMKLTNVLKKWREVEPRRFPYRFGGMGWGEPDPDLQTARFKELGAAVDASDLHGWPLELRSVVTSSGSIEYEARVVYAPLGVATNRTADPAEALLRAVVTASTMRQGEPLKREPSIVGMAVTSFPLTVNDIPPTTTPAEDLRVWARAEPEWFGGSSGHLASPTYRGTACHVLAPVHRALVALMYMPALTVAEATAKRNWGFRVRSELQDGRAAEYECEIALPNGAVVRGGSYPAIAPACVKAYLSALGTVSGEELDLTRRPTDRFSYEAIAIECEPGCRLRTPRGHGEEGMELVGRYVVLSCDLERIALSKPAGFKVVQHVPTVEEVDASVAVGLLPAPWP